MAYRRRLSRSPTAGPDRRVHRRGPGVPESAGFSVWHSGLPPPPPARVPSAGDCPFGGAEGTRSARPGRQHTPTHPPTHTHTHTPTAPHTNTICAPTNRAHEDFSAAPPPPVRGACPKNAILDCFDCFGCSGRPIACERAPVCTCLRDSGRYAVDTLFGFFDPLLPSNRRGFPANHRRLPSKRCRFPANRRWFPPTAVGYPPTAVGFPPTAVGYPPTAVGFRQPPSVTLHRRGFPSNRRRLPSNRRGFPPTTVGYPPTAVRYPPVPSVSLQPPSVTLHRRWFPPTAVGYPPTAVSYSPTARRLPFECRPEY